MVDPDLATLYSIMSKDFFIQMFDLATMNHRISVQSLIIISPNSKIQYFLELSRHLDDHITSCGHKSIRPFQYIAVNASFSL